MLTEDYCDFETAKLLKEKGFDEGCSFVVNAISKGVMPVSWPTTNSDIEDEKASLIALPTLQIAMKWLREVHNIHIAIIPCEVGAGVMDYTYVLYKIDAKDFYFKDLGIQGRADNISKISYEKVTEAAIKYCLENLI